MTASGRRGATRGHGDSESDSETRRLGVSGLPGRRPSESQALAGFKFSSATGSDPTRQAPSADFKLSCTAPLLVRVDPSLSWLLKGHTVTVLVDTGMEIELARPV